MLKKFALLPLLLAGSLLVTTVTAQVKKTPVKKKPVAAKTKVAIKPAVAKPAPAAAGTRVKLTTDSGVIVLRLYNQTPKHRDNFIKLVNEHFFDSLLFHRVINGFMIQGGDPLSKNAPPGVMLGSGDVGYKIPAEFDPNLYHKKGVLAAARDGNPEKASSGCQFYIVQGRKYTDAELDMLEQQMVQMGGTKFSSAKRTAYKTIGGTPFLDNNYTVFGEVESGLEVVDKIAGVPTAPGDRPIGDVHMKMEIIP